MSYLGLVTFNLVPGWHAFLFLAPLCGVSWITMLGHDTSSDSIGIQWLVAAPPHMPVASHVTPGQFYRNAFASEDKSWGSW